MTESLWREQSRETANLPKRPSETRVVHSLPVAWPHQAQRRNWRALRETSQVIWRETSRLVAEEKWRSDDCEIRKENSEAQGRSGNGALRL